MINREKKYLWFSPRTYILLSVLTIVNIILHYKYGITYYTNISSALLILAIIVILIRKIRQRNKTAQKNSDAINWKSPRKIEG